MKEITPVAVPGDYTSIAQIFKFKVSCPPKQAIILISPMYFSNTGTGFFAGETGEDFGYDYHNGYGGRNFTGPSAGLYYNNDEVWLLFHKENPKMFYGFFPKAKFYYGKELNPNKEQYESGTIDWSSLTKQFKENFARKPGIDVSRGEIEEFTKRMEEETGGSYD